MDGVNPARDAGRLVGRAEGQDQHRVQGPPEAAPAAAPVAEEAAVLGDALGDERVSELQQERASPPEEEDSLGVDLPTDRVGRRGVRARGHPRVASNTRIVARLPVDPGWRKSQA